MSPTVLGGRPYSVDEGAAAAPVVADRSPADGEVGVGPDRLVRALELLEAAAAAAATDGSG